MPTRPARHVSSATSDPYCSCRFGGVLRVGLVLDRLLRAKYSFLLARSEVVDSRDAFALKPIEISRAAFPFEPVASLPNYTCGAELEGNLYLAGPAGLTVLAADGGQLQRLRTGMELPVAPIVAVTTGRMRGANEQQVMLATAGAGVIILTVSRHGVVAAQQLLPATAETSDISALLVQPTGDLILGTKHSGVLTFSGTSLEPLPMHIPGWMQAGCR
jgi:hypothetical protein